VGGQFVGAGGEPAVLEVAGEFGPAVEIVERQAGPGDLAAAPDPGVGGRFSLSRPLLLPELLAALFVGAAVPDGGGVVLECLVHHRRMLVAASFHPCLPVRLALSLPAGAPSEPWDRPVG
jgi:hypothetical protein